MLVVKAVCHGKGCHDEVTVDAECIFDSEAANACLKEFDWSSDGDIHFCEECTKNKENQ